MASLCFTRDQLVAILDDFVNLLNDESFVEQLKQYAPNESRVSTVIEEKQCAIFREHGVDPSVGFRDMSRAKMVFPGDAELSQKLLFVAIREEATVSIALGQPSNSPNTMEEMQQNMLKIPSMLASMQHDVKNNPQLVSQMNDNQKMNFQKLMQFQQQINQEGNNTLFNSFFGGNNVTLPPNIPPMSNNVPRGRSMDDTDVD